MTCYLHLSSSPAWPADTWGTKGIQVISVVVSRSLTALLQCRWLAIFRLEREGTDPAWRGLAHGRQGYWATGGSP